MFSAIGHEVDLMQEMGVCRKTGLVQCCWTRCWVPVGATRPWQRRKWGASLTSHVSRHETSLILLNDSLLTLKRRHFLLVDMFLSHHVFYFLGLSCLFPS